MTFRRVTVTILEGRELGSSDDANPYVYATIGSAKKHRHQTRYHKATQNPVWNQTLVFEPVYFQQPTKQPTHPFNELRLAVFDHHALRADRPLGLCYQPIDDRHWAHGEMREFWLDLREGTGKLKVQIVIEKIYTERGARKMAKFIHDWHVAHPGQAWTDPDFPHDALSISRTGDTKGVAAWKRLSDLSTAPKLFEEKAQAGALGDCWLLGAMSILATQPKLVKNLFAGSNAEEGFYVLKFFITGEWRWVVIDDWLPVSAAGGICFGRNRDHDSFWVPLLEKAYAKLFGSYAAIEAGLTSEGLLDLTGEGAETFAIDDPRFMRFVETGQIEEIMKNWAKSRFLMGVSRTTDAGAGTEQDAGMGILAGHAYSVLKIKNPIVEKGFLGLVGNKRLVLVQLRNPWGEKEWTGAWSDGSKEWTPAIRKQLKHTDANDGVFWMEMDDFFKQFNRFSIVRMHSTKMSLFDARWHKFYFVSEWDSFCAGGCMNGPTWTKNTQYGLHVMDEKRPTTVFLYLSQNDRRLQGREEYQHSIGLYVLKVAAEPTTKCVDRGMFLKNTFPPWNDAPTFTNKRDVALRVDLDVGYYVIIPCTFDPSVEMPYALGIFAEHKAKAWEITEMQEIGIKGEWSDTTAGGPPNAGELARSDRGKGHSDFYNNPKVVLRWKRRVEDTFAVTVRVEILGDGPTAVGLRVYRKAKLHRSAPLAEKLVLETIQPAARSLEHTFTFHKNDGFFALVPFLPQAGTQGKWALSVRSMQAGLKVDSYF